LSAVDPELRRAAAGALAEAAAREGARLKLTEPGAPGATTVVVAAARAGPVLEIFGPLDAAARATLERDLTRAAGAARLREAGLRPDVLTAVRAVDAGLRQGLGPSHAAGPATSLGRLSLMVVLWGALVGSLGMLLQAVVRERVNRSLELLLASVRPSALVTGKLLGAGAVSVLVVAAWLGAGAALGVLPGAAGVIRAGFTGPELARAALIYPFAFAMYGAATVTVGVFARDLAAAQNLSRPVFGVLLLVFFGALAAAVAGEVGDFAALTWAPPLTPFMLLLYPDALSPAGQVAAFGLMALTAAAFAGWASRRLAVAG
jgi:ABC-2 type transport system permease protein